MTNITKFKPFQQVVITTEKGEEIKGLITNKTEKEEGAVVYSLLLANADVDKKNLNKDDILWKSIFPINFLKTTRILDPKKYGFAIVKNDKKILTVFTYDNSIPPITTMKETSKIIEIKEHNVTIEQAEEHYRKYEKIFWNLNHTILTILLNENINNLTNGLLNISFTPNNNPKTIPPKYKIQPPLESSAKNRENFQQFLNDITTKLKKESKFIFPLNYLKQNNENFNLKEKESVKQQIINQITAFINDISKKNPWLNNNSDLLSKYKVNIEIDPETIEKVDNNKIKFELKLTPSVFGENQLPIIVNFNLISIQYSNNLKETLLKDYFSQLTKKIELLTLNLNDFYQKNKTYLENTIEHLEKLQKKFSEFKNEYEKMQKNAEDNIKYFGLNQLKKITIPDNLIDLLPWKNDSNINLIEIIKNNFVTFTNSILNTLEHSKKIINEYDQLSIKSLNEKNEEIINKLWYSLYDSQKNKLLLKKIDHFLKKLDNNKSSNEYLLKNLQISPTAFLKINKIFDDLKAVINPDVFKKPNYWNRFCSFIRSWFTSKLKTKNQRALIKGKIDKNIEILKNSLDVVNTKKNQLLTIQSTINSTLKQLKLRFSPKDVNTISLNTKTSSNNSRVPARNIVGTIIS